MLLTWFNKLRSRRKGCHIAIFPIRLTIGSGTEPSRPRLQSSWGQHGAHLGPVGPRWAPCWPHEPYYQGTAILFLVWVIYFEACRKWQTYCIWHSLAVLRKFLYFTKSQWQSRSLMHLVAYGLSTLRVAVLQVYSWYPSILYLLIGKLLACC